MIDSEKTESEKKGYDASKKKKALDACGPLVRATNVIIIIIPETSGVVTFGGQLSQRLGVFLFDFDALLEKLHQILVVANVLTGGLADRLKTIPQLIGKALSCNLGGTE
jgi:hypothetical protein